MEARRRAASAFWKVQRREGPPFISCPRSSSRLINRIEDILHVVDAILYTVVRVVVAVVVQEKRSWGLEEAKR